MADAHSTAQFSNCSSAHNGGGRFPNRHWRPAGGTMVRGRVPCDQSWSRHQFVVSKDESSYLQQRVWPNSTEKSEKFSFCAPGADWLGRAMSSTTKKHRIFDSNESTHLTGRSTTSQILLSGKVSRKIVSLANKHFIFRNQRTLISLLISIFIYSSTGKQRTTRRRRPYMYGWKKRTELENKLVESLSALGQAYIQLYFRISVPVLQRVGSVELVDLISTPRLLGINL